MAGKNNEGVVNFLLSTPVINHRRERGGGSIDEFMPGPDHYRAKSTFLLIHQRSLDLFAFSITRFVCFLIALWFKCKESFPEAGKKKCLVITSLKSKNIR